MFIKNVFQKAVCGAGVGAVVALEPEFFMWSRSRNLKAAPPKQVKQIEKNLTLCKPQTKLFLNSKFVDAKFISGAGARAEQISSVE